MPSERDSTHLIGRSSLREAHAERDLLAVDLQLGAEAAADLGRDRPDALLADAQLQGQEQPQEMRYLGGAVSVSEPAR